MGFLHLIQITLVISVILLASFVKDGISSLNLNLILSIPFFFFLHSALELFRDTSFGVRAEPLSST